MNENLATRYTSRYVNHQGRGRVSARSLDIARSVVMNPKLSYSDVAKQFGVSRQRVGQIVRRMNVSKIKR
jgi:DNA-binding Lrp family transcriptional regulator